MNIKLLAAVVAGCIVTACGQGGDPLPRPAAAPRAAMDWRKVATDADRDRLRNWRDAWTAAMASVRDGGRAAAVTSMGALFEPDRALAGPMPSQGDYRCRTFKLGARSPGLPDYTVYPWFACRIEREGDVLSFSKESGSQRPVGLILDDGASRAIFLGTLMLGDESAPLQYGQDRARDLAGIVERIGDRRWRLAMPYPAYESTLDVIELVPAR